MSLLVAVLALVVAVYAGALLDAGDSDAREDVCPNARCGADQWPRLG